MNIDQILKQEKLRVNCPEGQEGLSYLIPEGEKPVDYENSYKVDYTVRCAFCAKRTPHQWGNTALMADGRRALCGNCCARRLFGAEIHQKLKEDLERRERAAIDRHLLLPLLSGIEGVVEEIRSEWLTLERRIVECASGIEELISKGWQQEASENGRLKATGVNGEFIGYVVGIRVLFAKRSLFEAASILFKINQHVSEKSSEKVLKDARLKKQEAVRLIEAGIESFAHAQRFFGGNENVDLLCAWYNSNREYYDYSRLAQYPAGRVKGKGMFGEECEWKSARHLKRYGRGVSETVDLLEPGDLSRLPSRERLVLPLLARRN